MNVGQIRILTRLGLRKDFRDQLMMFEPEWDKFLKSVSMDRPEVEAAVIAGPHRLIEVGELEPTTFFDAKLSGKIVGLSKEYRGGYTVSQRALEDDQYNKVNQGAKWLGESARLTKEYRAGAFLDDFFTGTIFKCIDGNPIGYNTHACFNSEINTTTATCPASTAMTGFSVAGISQLLELMELTKNWNGDPARLSMNAIIYSPKYIGLAMQIFGSDKEPFTDQNQPNQVAKRLSGVSQIVSHYKSSVETYMLFNQQYNDAQLLSRVALSLKDWIDNDTGALMVKARERFGIWCPDFHGWVGQNPS